MKNLLILSLIIMSFCPCFLYCADQDEEVRPSYSTSYFIDQVEPTHGSYSVHKVESTQWELLSSKQSSPRAQSVKVSEKNGKIRFLIGRDKQQVAAEIIVQNASKRQKTHVVKRRSISQQLEGGELSAYCVSGSYTAYGKKNGTVVITDASPVWIDYGTVHQNSFRAFDNVMVQGLCFSPRQRYLAVLSVAGCAQVWKRSASYSPILDNQRDGDSLSFDTSASFIKSSSASMSSTSSLSPLGKGSELVPDLVFEKGIVKKKCCLIQ